MICNTIGLTTDSFETLYVHGGEEVTEVYGGLNYAQPIFYSLKTLTGATSYSFMGYPEPLKSCEISGNMVQNGTPTPTSPIYPQECGDRTANLFDKDNALKNFYLYNGVQTGYYVGGYVLSDYIPIESNTATISAEGTKASSAGSHWAVYDENKSFIRGGAAFQAKLGVITKVVDTSGAAFIRVDYATEALTNCMLNLGSTALPYEPYGCKIPLSLNGTTQNLYLTEPLRKIGNYADEVNSDGTVTRRIKKHVLTGEEAIEGSSQRWIVRAKLSSSVAYIGKCTHFVNKSSGTVAWFDNKFSIEGANIFFGVYEMFGSISAFRQLLTDSYAAGNPVTVWYVLATPTTEQVTAPTLTPAIGNNTLAIGTTLQPSSVSITGHIKPSS